MDIRTKLMDLGQAGQLAFQVAREWWETGIFFSAFGKSFQNDPYSFYQDLRERDPIHRSYAANGWILTRYRDIEPILSDLDFSSDDRNLGVWEKLRTANIRRGVVAPDEEFEPTMLRADPPAHTRLRRLVNKAFTPRAVEKLRPRIEEIADELLSGVAQRSEMDLVSDLGVPLPIIVIAEMLGIPSQDREQFKIWSTDFADTVGRVTPESLIRARRSGEEFTEYIGKIAEERRREPRADLLSGLVAAEAEGDRLSASELAGTAALLLTAGNETTTNLICNGVLALLQNPEQLEELRSDPALIENAVEEFLRYDSPVQATARIVMEDQEFVGNPFKKGQQISLLIGAANRDPEVFDDPDRLNLKRERIAHLSFSRGAHFCLGAQLARLEAQVAIGELVRRLPGMKLASDTIERNGHLLLRGVKALPLRF